MRLAVIGVHRLVRKFEFKLVEKNNRRGFEAIVLHRGNVYLQLPKTLFSVANREIKLLHADNVEYHTQIIEQCIAKEVGAIQFYPQTQLGTYQPSSPTLNLATMGTPLHITTLRPPNLHPLILTILPTFPGLVHNPQLERAG